MGWGGVRCGGVGGGREGSFAAQGALSEFVDMHPTCTQRKLG